MDASQATHIYNNNNKKKIPSKMLNQGSLLVEPQLYATELTFGTTEEYFKNLFKEIEAISVEIRRQPNNDNSNGLTAVLRFSTTENAEKAFACYNNNKSEVNKSYLKLVFNDPSTGNNEPQSNAYILQVKQLPQETTNLALYELFRPYGPLFSCRMQNQADKYKGSAGFAFVQFFRQEDADDALRALNSSPYNGRNLNVTQYPANKNNPLKIRTNVVNNNNFNLPSAGHAFPLQGSNNSNNNNNQSVPPSPGPEGPIVDPCNLFIKNLDANISSSDLFHHFRRFGRIISARVMRDQESGNSKGFGFVSYTTAEEADRAKSSMHGKILGTKQIVVRLHEPKKLREAKLANQFNGNPASPSESRAPSRRNSDFFNINSVNEFAQEDLSGLAPKARKEIFMSELQKRFRYIPSVPPDEVNPIIEQLLTCKVQEILQMLKDASILQQRITDARNTIISDRKRRSNEETSVPTTSISNNIIMSNNNSNNNAQQQTPKDKFLKAINRICPHNSTEVLDLLMTLSQKERSLCYFNTEYLNKKIIEANSALEAIHNDETSTTNSKPLMSADLTPASTPLMKSIEAHSVRSAYITDVPTVAGNGINTPEYKEIEEFMDGLKSKPIHEQKQKLGDRLFPKVKKLVQKSATASKVTINLLDTDDLRDLAHSMNDPVAFPQKVKNAAEKILPSK